MSFEIELPTEAQPTHEITAEQQMRFCQEMLALQQIAKDETDGLSLVVADIPELEYDIELQFNNIRGKVAGHLQGRGLAQLGARMGLSGIMAVPDGKEFSIQQIEEDVHIEGTIGGCALELLPDVEGEFDSTKQRVIPSVMIRLRDVNRVLTGDEGEVIYVEPVEGDVYVPLVYKDVEPFLLPTEPIHKEFDLKLGATVIDAYRSLFTTETQREMVGPEDMEKVLLSLEDQEINDTVLDTALARVQSIIDVEIFADGRDPNAMSPQDVLDFSEKLAPQVVTALYESGALWSGLPFLTAGPGLVAVASGDSTIGKHHLLREGSIVSGVIKTFSILLVPSPKWVKEHTVPADDQPRVHVANDSHISFAVVLEQASYSEGRVVNGKVVRRDNRANHGIIVPAVYRMKSRAVRED